MRISETEKYARFASSGVPGMADILKGGELGDAKISETDISPESAKLANTLNRNYGHFRILPGKYVRLHVNGQLMMSDTPMERITNSGFLHAASGRILIAGLGIGLIIRPIIRSPKVKQIVAKLVVEQMSGRWRMKAGRYIDHAKRSQQLLAMFRGKINIRWVPREQNGRADELSKSSLEKNNVTFKIQPK